MKQRSNRARTTVAALAAGLLALTGMSLLGPFPAGATADFDLTRVGGDDRYATSAQVATGSFPQGADTVLIASGEAGHFPDALAGNYLAGHQDGGAPILLVRSGSVPAPVQQAIDQLNPERAFVLGDHGAVSGAVATGLRDQGIRVTRYGGDDRYRTMRAIIEGAGEPGTHLARKTAIVATGQKFPDALAAGPIAFARKFPIVLVKERTLPDPARAVLTGLGIEQVIIAGGTGTVSKEVEDAIHRLGITTLYRAAGAGRSDTSRLLADFAIEQLGFSDSHLDVATGAAALDGVDALSAGPHAGQAGPAVLLITRNSTHAGQADDFAAGHTATLTSGHVFGQTGSVSTGVAQEITHAARTGEVGDPAGCGGGAAIPRSECRALVDIARANPDASLSDWDTGDPCTWQGVSCGGGHVTRLNLHRTGLTSLPASVGYLTGLTFLGLGANQLTSLPDSIGNLTDLTTLDANENQLTSLPAGIGNLTNLTALSLAANQLTSLPDSIGNLSRLTSVFLVDNQLSSLPASIGDLAQLRSLNLKRNNLTTLPDSIGNLSSLTSLTLAGNRLVSLPTGIGKLSNLTGLEARHNRLDSLPDSVGNLTSLATLGLAHNQLASIPASIGDLENLTYLDLSANELTSLPDSIGSITPLVSLSVSDNQLTGLPDSIGNLANLGGLYAGNNGLTGDVTPWATGLHQSGNLRWLELEGNGCLTTSDAGLADWLSRLAPQWQSGCST